MTEGDMMRVVIAGGSGFIGQKLTEMLRDNGDEIVILSRKDRQADGKVSYVKWLGEGAKPEQEIGFVDAFINLAGVSINAGRWSKKHQQQIYESRMSATNELLRIIAAMEEKPTVLVNASAIGIYPASEEVVYTEKSLEQADDFLAQTVADWEKKAFAAASFGVRTVMMRFGVVLGSKGGALPLMVLPYRLWAGGTVGSGKQWVSWVHVMDVARSICFALKLDTLQGPVNVTAPNSVNMKDFGKTIGSVLHRPHWLPVPAFMLELALGQKSKLVLEGQHVVPEQLLENGFEFSYPKLETALKDLLR
jgi:uncharacterized protein (TIGR01777 family)